MRPIMEIDTTRSPLRTLAAWIEEARTRGIKDADAMALASATPDGIPSVRIVLCRGLDDDGIRFFTNYESRKGQELEANARAAAVFHWRELERQVRVEGTVTRTDAAVSDAYFASRPRGNRIASTVSPQSRPIESMESLRASYEALEKEREGHELPRPAHWGGFSLRATAVELWVASPVRLHECVRYERHGEGWTAARRAP
jgi:pyridoxamine 5'-phosphate oxidase